MVSACVNARTIAGRRAPIAERLQSTWMIVDQLIKRKRKKKPLHLLPATQERGVLRVASCEGGKGLFRVLSLTRTRVGTNKACTLLKKKKMNEGLDLFYYLFFFYPYQQSIICVPTRYFFFFFLLLSSFLFSFLLFFRAFFFTCLLLRDGYLATEIPPSVCFAPSAACMYCSGQKSHVSPFRFDCAFVFRFLRMMDGGGSD